jgi:LPXTG-site transpeptidase (sortase) family protein
VELDREGIIRLDDTRVPWKKNSNTVVVGHALGYLWTKTTYVFYELDQLEPGDEILAKDQKDGEYTFKVYDRMTVRPEDFWITNPGPDKTVISYTDLHPHPHLRGPAHHSRGTGELVDRSISWLVFQQGLRRRRTAARKALRRSLEITYRSSNTSRTPSMAGS